VAICYFCEIENPKTSAFCGKCGNVLLDFSDYIKFDVLLLATEKHEEDVGFRIEEFRKEMFAKYKDNRCVHKFTELNIERDHHTKIEHSKVQKALATFEWLFKEDEVIPVIEKHDIIFSDYIYDTIVDFCEINGIELKLHFRKIVSEKDIKTFYDAIEKVRDEINAAHNPH